MTAIVEEQGDGGVSPTDQCFLRPTIPPVATRRPTARRTADEPLGKRNRMWGRREKLISQPSFNFGKTQPVGVCLLCDRINWNWDFRRNPPNLKQSGAQRIHQSCSLQPRLAIAAPGRRPVTHKSSPFQPGSWPV